MTVKQLIAKLEKIENKDLPVAIGIEHGWGEYMTCQDVGLRHDCNGDNELCGVVISGEEDTDE